MADSSTNGANLQPVEPASAPTSASASARVPAAAPQPAAAPARTGEREPPSGSERVRLPLAEAKARAAAADETAEPLRFGKFRLLEELSRTPNSVVYRAIQDDLHGRDVAVKVLVEPPAEQPDEADDRATRFRREVENIAKLRHPNIVSVYEVGEIDGFTYFSMEYVAGCSLAHWIAEHGPMSGQEAAELMVKVARAIHYAHTRGIIHRDIKPGNILLDRVNGEPMIADFGLAKDIRSDIRITQSGVTVGTPPYMPPEQARGQHDALDSRSDVYALGATLYELVTGRPPFDGETGIQVMMRVLERAPVRPRRLVPSVSPDLEAITLKCLAKRQRERYDNAELLAQDLVRFLRADWVLARKATLVHRVGRFLKAYRNAAYFLLALTVVYAVTLASQYVADNANQSQQRVPVVPGGAEAVAWRAVEGRGSVELLMPMELWLNDPTRALDVNAAAPSPRSARRPQAAQEALAISTEALRLRDFELRFQAEILGSSHDALCEPNLGVFLVPNAEAAQLPAGSWPPIREGYLFLLGARDNTRTALYRIEGSTDAPVGGQPRPGRLVALLEEPRLRVREHSKYDIAVSVVGSRLTLDVRDVARRQRWRLEVTDDFPLPIPATSHLGFYTLGSTAVIERWALAAHSWQGNSPRLDRGDGFFQIGAYEEALRYYEAALHFAREDPGQRNQLTERIALTREALQAGAPLAAVAAYEPLHRRRASLRASRRLIECYVRGGLGEAAHEVLADVLARDEEGLGRVGETDRRWLVPAGRRWGAALAEQAQAAAWPFEASWLPRAEWPSADTVAMAEVEAAEVALHYVAESPSPYDTARAARAVFRDTRRLLTQPTPANEARRRPHDLVTYVDLLARECEIAGWLARATGNAAEMRLLQQEVAGAELHRWLHEGLTREPPQVLLDVLHEVVRACRAVQRPRAPLVLLLRTADTGDRAAGAAGAETQGHLLDGLAATRLPLERVTALAQVAANLAREHELHDDPLLTRLEEWLHERQ